MYKQSVLQVASAALKTNVKRHLSELPPITKSPAAVAASSRSSSPVSSGGSTFIQRLSSFFVGAGVGFGVAFYYIYEELKDSNNKIEAYIHAQEARLQKLEKK